MPSPRFGRLPPERRSRIVTVARHHLAREGLDGASYNQIIAEAGISKTTAYLYFDGKQDLITEVRRDLYARLNEVMGVWRPAGTSKRFWAQLRATTEALHQHLLTHPDDLAVLAQPGSLDEATDFDAWFGAMLDDGRSLGVVRDDVERPLLLAATLAVFRVLDEWVLAALLRGESVDRQPAWRLLQGLWTKPSSAASRGRRRPRAEEGSR